MKRYDVHWDRLPPELGTDYLLNFLTEEALAKWDRSRDGHENYDFDTTTASMVKLSF